MALEEAKYWLTHNSATYRMFTAAVQQNLWLRDLAVRANLLIPNIHGMTKNTYSQATIERSANRVAGEIAHRYKHSAILIVPSRGLWVGNNRFVEARVHREFIAALVARHLNVIDMRKTFEQRRRPTRKSFPQRRALEPKRPSISRRGACRGVQQTVLPITFVAHERPLRGCVAKLSDGARVSRSGSYFEHSSPTISGPGSFCEAGCRRRPAPDRPTTMSARVHSAASRH